MEPEASTLLDGVHVVDWGMNIAGPYAATILAEFGAEVVKIEPPEGDSARSYPPFSGGISTLFATVNRGKRYAALNLKDERARSALMKPILCWADVVIQNLRPGTATSLGIDASQCHAVNPRLIHASVEAFYPDGGSRPGYDLMVQAESGIMSLTGESGAPPSRLPGSLLDYITGMWTALGIVAALRGPRENATVQITMLDAALSLIGDKVAAYLLTGDIPKRMGSALSTTTPHQAFATSDGEVVVGAANDRLFQRFAGEVDESMRTDPRYATQESRLANREALTTQAVRALATTSTDLWLERLEAAGVPVARIRDLPDAVERHRAMSRTGIVRIEGTEIEVVASPLSMPDGVPLHKPGGLGSDSSEVFRGLAGLSELEYSQLVVDGVVVE
jgi:crotonobetainyl-CoA:carnitine CoA-transferase CaiB-like acyl-CoA transferase